jgi:hypothetical protein
MITGHLLSRGARAGQVQRGERAEGLGQSGIGEVVADAPPFEGGGDESALAQAGEVVGEVGSARADGGGELGRIAGPGEEFDEDALPGGVGEGSADATQDVQIDHDG